MSLREVCAALDRLRDGGVRTVIFSGGEPLLYDFFWDALSHAKDLGFECNVMTNASLLDGNTADVLGSFNVPVWLSLDYFNEKAQRAWRGGASFQNMFGFIEKRLIDAMPVGIRSTLMWNNFGDVKNIAGFCHRQRIPMVAMRIVNCKVNRVWREPSKDDLKELYQGFARWHLLVDDPPFYLHRDSTLDDVFLAQSGFVCEAFAHRVSVDPRGDVYPCPFLSTPGLCYGNIFSDDWSVIEAGHARFQRGLMSCRDCGGSCWFRHQPYSESDQHFRLISGCRGGCIARSYWRYARENCVLLSLDDLDKLVLYDSACPYYRGAV